MADNHQRIHPVDVEAAAATPTAPLVSRDASKSDQGDPAVHQGGEQYPPFRRTIPLAQSKPPKRRRRSCCCRCLCWTLSLILLLVIIIAAAAGILYLVFRPKLPKYSIDQLTISDFQLSTNNSLYARFDVTITARNPNKKIGIYYKKGSRLSVFYSDTKLCEGALPVFYQGHRNTTAMQVALTGQNANASGLLASVTEQQRQTGKIPLTLRARVPVRVKVGKLTLRKVKFLVRCGLVVDNLTADYTIRIRTSSCKFRFRL
ncbi:hypothetical protein Scep_015896 [Stephania cephalantha]|uniref:Late embryogenesis abundant protein LEA-2 subgroup domain-containing protein n=1 Tax=Stephania cephalantha TaxID=152367 RepID=A0AAP0NSP7_9MAGN